MTNKNAAYIGQVVETDYPHCDHRRTRHTITAIRHNQRGCQTGTLFQITPPGRKGQEDAWLDSAWFEEVSDADKNP